MMHDRIFSIIVTVAVHRQENRFKIDKSSIRVVDCSIGVFSSS